MLSQVCQVKFGYSDEGKNECSKPCVHCARITYNFYAAESATRRMCSNTKGHICGDTRLAVGSRIFCCRIKSNLKDGFCHFAPAFSQLTLQYDFATHCDLVSMWQNRSECASRGTSDVLFILIRTRTNPCEHTPYIRLY